VEFKTRAVPGVLPGMMSAAEAALRHGVSETTIGKWKDVASCPQRPLPRPSRSARRTGSESS
jgi:transposase-like protein